MAAQAHMQNQNLAENFQDNHFNQKSSDKSHQVLAGDDTKFKIENRSRPNWFKESFKVRPTGESFAIQRSRAFQTLQNKAHK